jgi:hypothetical protein
MENGGLTDYSTREYLLRLSRLVPSTKMWIAVVRYIHMRGKYLVFRYHIPTVQLISNQSTEDD